MNLSTEPPKFVDHLVSPKKNEMMIPEYICSFVKHLSVSDTMVQACWSMLQNLNSLKPDVFKLSVEWFASLLFITMSEARYQGDKKDGTFVSDLLEQSNISMVKLFNMIKLIEERCQWSDQFLADSVKLQKNYLFFCPLYFKFVKLFQKIFKIEKAEEDVYSEIKLMKNQIWTLFVYVKNVSFNETPFLVLAFQLLIGCFEFVLRFCSSQQLNPPFDSLVSLEMTEEINQPVITALCEAHGLNVNEVISVSNNYLSPVTKTLSQDSVLNVKSLREKYVEVNAQGLNFNELDFLEEKPYLLTEELRRKSLLSTNSASVPVPLTPVRSALSSVHQLKTLLENTLDQPLPSLLLHFKNCSIDPSCSIQERIQKCEAAFLISFKSVMGDRNENVGKQIYQLSLRLYYRVMESLLKSESIRLSMQDFSQLLNYDVFHKCLLACSVEVVMTTYSISAPSSHLSPSKAQEDTDLTFPWVLKTFSIQAYDFYKVLESFIKAEPCLTSDIIKHLHQTENKILEKQAWEEGSSLFDLISVANIETSSTHAEDTPPTASQLYFSPLRPQKVSPANHKVSPVNPSSISSPIKSHSLNNFFNKVCHLAHQRLKNLGKLLELSTDLLEKIWLCLEYCILRRPDMLKRRHLDQILMCCIFAICRVTDSCIKFKDIVNMYKISTQCSSKIYKKVLVTDGKFDSIITFYNNVFQHQLKSYIFQFHPQSRSGIPPSLSPVSKSFTSDPHNQSPVFSLPGRSNFFVSPLKTTPFKTPLTPGSLTPRSQRLYSFGDCQSAEKLKEINETMRAFQTKLSKPSDDTRGTKLTFDKPNSSSGSLSNFILKRNAPSNSEVQPRKCLRFDDDPTSQTKKMNS